MNIKQKVWLRGFADDLEQSRKIVFENGINLTLKEFIESIDDRIENYKTFLKKTKNKKWHHMIVALDELKTWITRL